MSLAAVLSMTGASLGGLIGWYIGKPVGLTTAFIISMIGTGFGMYYGRIIGKHWS